MPSADIVRSTEVVRTVRVRQVEGMFDLPGASTMTRRWHVHLPIEDRPWQIGLIVGPSGSGKSTIARELFGDAVMSSWDWPDRGAVVDGFPEEWSIREITTLLSSVGFSSPPSWLRPFSTLSNGEQFRVTMARMLAEHPRRVVVDEYTSVVDRRVAQIGSAAVAKAVRRGTSEFVAVTCHEDVEDWLDPDWVYRPSDDSFRWRRLRRHPGISVTVRRADRSQWGLFREHHYLSHSLSRSAQCFLAEVDGSPAAWTSVLFWPHPSRPGWREHRTVCLPDFQGVGIGNGLSEFVAGMFRATGLVYRSVTSSPAMMLHRARSPLWRMTRAPSRVASAPKLMSLRSSVSTRRRTASFEYVGPRLSEEAARFGIIQANPERNRSGTAPSAEANVRQIDGEGANGDCGSASFG